MNAWNTSNMGYTMINQYDNKCQIKFWLSQSVSVKHAISMIWFRNFAAKNYNNDVYKSGQTGLLTNNNNNKIMHDCI